MAWFGVVGCFATDGKVLIEFVGCTLVTLALLVVLNLGDVDSLVKSELFAEKHKKYV